MNIFNSLGSNYRFSTAQFALVTPDFKYFRKRLRKYLNDRYDCRSVLLSKGREAIELALRISELPPGSKVAVNGFTCFVVVDAIKRAGFIPKFIDIKMDILHFTPEALETAVKKDPSIRVVLIQNTLGFPCRIQEIKRLCQKYNLILIEDLAHSVGCMYDAVREAGTVGDFAALSFSQDKSIDAVTGGALLVRNRKFFHSVSEIHVACLPLLQSLRYRIYPILTWWIRTLYPFRLGAVLHWFAKTSRVLSLPIDNSDKPTQYDIPGWCASFAYREYKDLQKLLFHRKKIAHIYAHYLLPIVSFPKLNDWIKYSSCIRFPVRIPDRSRFLAYCKKYGLYIADIWYDAPVAPKKMIRNSSYVHGSCPVGEAVSAEIVNLPTHIGISPKTAEKICRFINNYVRLDTKKITESV